MMIKSEKRSSIMCARALKRAAAAMPRWAGAKGGRGELRRGDLVTGRRGEKGGVVDAKWRRVSGMTVSIETFMDRGERRAAIGRLVKWLKNKTRRGDLVTGGRGETLGLKSDVQRHRSENGFRPMAPDGAVHGGMLDGCDLETGAGGTDFRFSQTGMSAPPGGTGMSAPLNSIFLRVDEERCEAASVSLAADWDFSAREWACASERSVESLCRELGISHGGLTRLTKEYSGTTAQETLDGFKMGRLKHVLMERLRELARGLWGVPGDYVKMQCIERPRSLMTSDGNVFRQSQQALFEETEEEAVERRSGEIFSAVREIDFQGLALGCGFGSAARLKQACVNVFGKTGHSLLKILAREVLEFYLCAEQKALRDLASREPASAMVMRARTLYWDDEKAPAAPFCDRWSAAEFGRRDWLLKMWDALG